MAVASLSSNSGRKNRINYEAFNYNLHVNEASLTFVQCIQLIQRAHYLFPSSLESVTKSRDPHLMHRGNRSGFWKLPRIKCMHCWDKKIWVWIVAAFRGLIVPTASFLKPSHFLTQEFYNYDSVCQKVSLFAGRTAGEPQKINRKQQPYEDLRF